MKLLFKTLIISLVVFSVGCKSEPKDPAVAAAEAAAEAHKKIPMIKEIQNDKIILDNGESVDLPTDQSVIFMVRHAETSPTETSDTRTLTVNGEKRANRLKDFLAEIELAGVLSTPTVRAAQTGEPTVKSKEGIGLLSYNHNNTGRVYDFAFSYDLGKRLLVIGHSNTVPAMVRELTGDETSASDISHDIFDDIYIVSGTGKGNCTALHFRY